MNAITVPMQLHMRARFADSSPMASLNPEKIIPPTQTIGARTFKIALSRFAIMPSMLANAGDGIARIRTSADIIAKFTLGLRALFETGVLEFPVFTSKQFAVISPILINEFDFFDSDFSEPFLNGKVIPMLLVVFFRSSLHD